MDVNELVTVRFATDGTALRGGAVASRRGVGGHRGGVGVEVGGG